MSSQPQTRVLYFITSPLSAHFLRGQLGFLSQRGFEVGVCTNVEPGSAAELFDSGTHFFRAPFVREPAPLSDLRCLLVAIRVIRDFRPRIVNASTPKAGLLGMLAAFLCRAPVRLYVVRGLRYETTTGARRWLYWAMEWTAMRCATDVVFNSQSLRTAARDHSLCRRRGGLVLGAGSGNGIDVNRLSPMPSKSEARAQLQLPADAFVVGFVGRLTKDKGINDLLDAFERILEEYGSAHLLVVGSYEDGDPLSELTRQTIEASPSISFLGFMDNPASAYAAMDVLAFASYREGLPNAPLEAQLAGVPVVAYAATGTVDALRDGLTGLLVPVGDHQALAEAVLSLATNRDRLAELSAAGPSWVSANFERTAVWSNLASFYSTALAR